MSQPLWQSALEARIPPKPVKVMPLRERLLARGVLWLLDGVATRYGVTLEEMFAAARLGTRVNRARQHAWWELRQRGLWSYPDIGKLWGRDHSTIMAGVRQHERRRSAP